MHAVGSSYFTNLKSHVLACHGFAMIMNPCGYGNVLSVNNHLAKVSSHFVNSHFVNSQTLTKWELTKWELTKWEVDEVGIDKVGIDKVGINPC